MYGRLFELPNTSFFLFGPRGSGKTSFLKEHLRPALHVDLLSQELFIRYASEPGLFRSKIQVLKAGDWVWIDEVQRLPSLLNEVHWGIENKQLKFALSGSSARKMKRAGVNLLAGRALSKLMFPFVPEELGKDFDLDQILRFGSLPIVFASEDKKERLKAYVQTYIRDEIQTEALVKDLPSFLRFLKVSALLHGQTLSLSSVARDAAVKRPTVENYFSILEDTLLGKLLYPFESGLRVKERRHPKFYWVDPGLVRAIREDWGPLVATERGPLFEGLVFMLLRSAQYYQGTIDEISYWGTPDLEVDFIVKAHSKFAAVEVKSGERLRKDDLAGLKSIGDLPKLKRRILVYPSVEHQETSDGIEVMGFQQFSDELKTGLV